MVVLGGGGLFLMSEVPLYFLVQVGVLNYSPALARTIDGLQEIAAGCEEEVSHAGEGPSSPDNRLLNLLSRRQFHPGCFSCLYC